MVAIFFVEKTGGWADGRMVGWSDGRMVGWSDGCSARVKTHIKTYHLFSNNRDDDVNHLL
jgi:hypothetical protein